MQTQAFIAHWLPILEGLLPVVMIALLIVATIFFVAIRMLDVLDFRRLARGKAVFLEVTPPALTDKALEATQHLFLVLHGLEEGRSLAEKLLRHKVTFTSEVVASREQGIRFVMRMAESEVHTFERTIVSYLPDAKLRRIDDYLPMIGDARHVKVLEVKQKGYFAYPLNTQVSLDQLDPMAYLTGAMTKLAPGELMVLQLVISPATVREANAVAGRLLHNEELVYRLGKHRRFSMTGLYTAINSMLFGILEEIGKGFSGTPTPNSSGSSSLDQHNQQVALKIKPARVLPVFEQQLAEAVNNKLSQPLFRVSIRALVVVNDKQRLRQRTKSIGDWLSSFNVPNYQWLRLRFSYPVWLWERYRLFMFYDRLPPMVVGQKNLFSASEIADLYHFPHSQTGKTENVVTSLSKILPATVALKNGAKFDVVLGRNQHQGTSTDIGLTAEERERHVFVVGGTGNGKTTLLKYGIVQDIRAGKGVAVLDPHGDLAQEVLTYIPKERIKDVIYFNPSDLSFPIGLNLLELPEGLTGDELLDAKDFIAETVVSLMRKTFSADGSGGHRIEYVLRNTVHTALTVKGATLFTVYDLLTDDKFRKPIVAKLEVPWLKKFWQNEYGKAGDYQQVSMMGGVTAKIGRFHASVSADRIMSQSKSTINFDEILDGKILICNLAKGLVGEDTSEVLGIAILAKLQLAAYARIKRKQADRRPFYAYVDEFQNFATMSFVQMLSESRKYKLFLTMAEQTTSQQEDQKMVNIILANVGTIVCFKSSSPADERELLPIFYPYVEQGEIANLPARSFYARLCGMLVPQEPVSGVTLVLEDNGSDDVAEAVIDASRANYAKKYVAPVVANPKKSVSKVAANVSVERKVANDAVEILDLLPVDSEG